MKYRQYKAYIMPALMILATAVTCLVFFIAPARSQQGAYFSDQFNMNDYNWTPYRGQWAVINGKYTELVDPDSDEAWSVAGSISWFDYLVQAEVTSTDKDGTISLAGRWSNEKNFYALEYSSDETGPDSAKLTVYKKVNGKRVDLAQWKRIDDPRIPYIGEDADSIEGNLYPAVLKLKFSGSNIEVYAGTELIGFTSDYSLYYGKIAVGEFNRQAYFDEIYVWDITPPRLFPITIPYIVGNAATLEFSTDEYASSKVEYGLTPEYGSSKVYTVRKVDHSIDISGLTPNTTYYYRVTVTDAAGNSRQSAGSTFTTGSTPDLVAPVVYDVGYESTSHDRTVITWKSDEKGNSIVDYGLSSGAYKWSLSYDEKTTDHSVHLTRLEGSTTYYFRVKTRDVAGNLGVSPEFSFTTPKNLKPRVNKVLTGSSPSYNLEVYWAPVPEAVRYKLYVSTSNQWADEPDAVINETGQEQYSFQKFDLVSNTNYFIKIVAEDSGGDANFTIARAFPPSTNPHGYYWDNPELCQNCHATHSAVGPSLIVDVSPDRLCITCHDGSQSKYDVLRGKYKGPDNELYDSIAGPYGSLEGVEVPEEAQLTSRHDLDIFIYTATGNNIENDEMSHDNLSCASCHDPHGSENYRNLRGNMRVLIDMDTSPIVHEAYAVTGAEAEEIIYVSGAVDFCGACHSDFNQGAGASRIARINTEQPGMQLSAASLHKYMHPVNIDGRYVNQKHGIVMDLPSDLPFENGRIICQTCHFTHGTTNTGSHRRRDGFSSTVLKRFDETIGCEACHNKTDYPDG